MSQQIIMTVGCPGAGKTTFARTNYPEWVTLSLDDFRTLLFRDKQSYHRQHASNPRMRSLLNDAYEDTLRTALGYGFNLILANMHVYPNSFASTLAIAKRFGIVPELRVFLLPLDTLLHRNVWRVECDRVPEQFIRDSYRDLNAPDAWWRSHPNKIIVED